MSLTDDHKPLLREDGTPYYVQLAAILRRQIADETWQVGDRLPTLKELVALFGVALVAIVTATNSFVTGPIARAFGIPHLVATIPAQQDGCFTGQPRGTPAFKAGKIARVDAWLESMGLFFGSFRSSYFYSDSHNDLPLLEKITNPVAVDPDDTLRSHAERRGWPVISLR